MIDDPSRRTHSTVKVHIVYTHNSLNLIDLDGLYSIYAHVICVQGKRKMVDGFLRWCKRADVGLSQKITVADVLEEEPTGLYDDFYVKMRE